MRLRRKLNIIFSLVVTAVLFITVFSFLAVYNTLGDLKGDYEFAAQRLSTNMYALIIASALIATGGILIFRVLINRALGFIEELNGFAQGMIDKPQDVKLTTRQRGTDEISLLTANLNRMADSYREKISVLENAMTKRQKAVRELAILNELMGFITSEVKSDIILKNFATRTSDLVKSDYCAIIIFEPNSFFVKSFVTKEGAQDSSKITIDPEGFFKQILKDMLPVRISSQQDAAGRSYKRINIHELNLEAKDIMACPLIFSNKLSGILVLADKAEGSFDQEDEDTLINFTFQAFQTIAMHEEIANLAVTDGLTGLNNHRHFQEELTRAVSLANRYEKSLSLLILDIDNFKIFNDIYGHQVGDVVLKSIAGIINAHARKTDFAARYGGEEFAVIMPETNYDGAKTLAERLRQKIAGTPFELSDGEKAIITVSIGFATIPENTEDKSQLVEMADRALYYAKEHGRNLSCGYSDSFEGKDIRRPGIQDALTVESLSDLADSKAEYTKGHSREVAKLSVMLAAKMGLSESDIENLRIASILHDIGIINIPSGVLNKPDTLNEDEKKIINAHPMLAELMLKNHPKINSVLPIILYHHERYDGKGYPIGISGDVIPLNARILAIAEAFHAMISPRPYRRKLPVEEACRELNDQAGLQFDPQLVEIFINTLKENNYK